MKKDQLTSRELKLAKRKLTGEKGFNNEESRIITNVVKKLDPNSRLRIQLEDSTANTDIETNYEILKLKAHPADYSIDDIKRMLEIGGAGLVNYRLEKILENAVVRIINNINRNNKNKIINNSESRDLIYLTLKGFFSCEKYHFKYLNSLENGPVFKVDHRHYESDLKTFLENLKEVLDNCDPILKEILEETRTYEDYCKFIEKMEEHKVSNDSSNTMYRCEDCNDLCDSCDCAFECEDPQEYELEEGFDELDDSDIENDFNYIKPHVKSQIFGLRLAGKNYQEISEMFNIDIAVIVYIIKEIYIESIDEVKKQLDELDKDISLPSSDLVKAIKMFKNGLPVNEIAEDLKVEEFTIALYLFDLEYLDFKGKERKVV